MSRQCLIDQRRDAMVVGELNQPSASRCHARSAFADPHPRLRDRRPQQQASNNANSARNEEPAAALFWSESGGDEAREGMPAGAVGARMTRAPPRAHYNTEAPAVTIPGSFTPTCLQSYSNP